MNWKDDYWSKKRRKRITSFKPINIHFNLDTDRDGVPDWKDCQPFNPLRQDKRVLDIGAGSSPNTYATHAIDLREPEMNFPDIEYKWGYDFNKETTNLPYPSNYFDMVISTGGLARNFESKNIFKEIFRVLVPGGVLKFNGDVIFKEAKISLEKFGFRTVEEEDIYEPYLNEYVTYIVAYK